MSIKTPVPQSMDSPAEIPTRIGAWEIQGVLGRGASATIYLGRELFPVMATLLAHVVQLDRHLQEQPPGVSP